MGKEGGIGEGGRGKMERKHRQTYKHLCDL